MRQDLKGKWQVYRFNLARHVLREPVTELLISAPPPPDKEEATYVAEFQLSGFDTGFKVLMDKAGPGQAGLGQEGWAEEWSQERKTDTWFGEKGSFDFRLDRHKDNSGVLFGYAADRQFLAYRDPFVALSTARLPSEQGTTWLDAYEFKHCYATPLARTRPSTKGKTKTVIDRAGKTISFDGKLFDHYTEASYQTGIKVTGAYNPPDGQAENIVLWLIPNGGSQHPLAIGCHYITHFSVPDSPRATDNVPGNPMCGKTIFLA